MWTPEGPVVELTDGVYDSSLVSDNLSGSPLLYLSPKLKGRDGLPKLVVFGYAWESDPGSLQVLALNTAGDPVVVFTSKRYELMEIADLDGDGVAEMIGKHSFSQCGGCHGCSYDPYAVYSFQRENAAPAIYRVDLSRRYNETHYVWAGRRASESICVSRSAAGRYHLVQPR